MYPPKPDEFMKSPPPSAPADNYGYAQAAQPPPFTGIPVTTQGYANYEGVMAPPAQHQTTPGQWSTGLCDCGSDVSNCCITCCCPCITFGQIAEIVDKGSTPCGTSGALYALLMYLTGCGWIYSCLYRQRMRKEYMLPESPCADCLVHFCCEHCAFVSRVSGAQKPRI